MEKIDHHHRVKAANSINGTDEKSVGIRARIIAGDANDHPAVQAAAFYEKHPARK